MVASNRGGPDPVEAEVYGATSRVWSGSTWSSNEVNVNEGVKVHGARQRPRQRNVNDNVNVYATFRRRGRTYSAARRRSLIRLISWLQAFAVFRTRFQGPAMSAVATAVPNNDGVFCVGIGAPASVSSGTQVSRSVADHRVGGESFWITGSTGGRLWAKCTGAGAGATGRSARRLRA